MENYLKEFYKRLKKYEGSLVKVSSIKNLNIYAKEYLIKLAKFGKIEKIAWGWYYILPKVEPRDALEFLAKDRNFKVVIGQTAASFWNQDFIHRNVVTISVNNLSYKKALEAFAKKRKWNMLIEYNKRGENIKYTKFGNLLIEDRHQTIIDCMKRWAFIDAIAILSANKNLSFHQLIKNSFWIRISRTDVRVKQAIEYVVCKLPKDGETKIDIKNEFIRAELDEAISKVSEFE